MDNYLVDGFLRAAGTPESITKTAAQKPDDEACKLLSMYTAFTRALYLLHQENHWQAQDYGQHLLFQRLYEEASELQDDAAERTMGLCGELLLEGAESVIAKRFAARAPGLIECLESSLSIEKAFQEVCLDTYKILKEKDMLTLGLDDMIMSQAGIGETHIYLLQQALEGVE
jgi:DNA-binding ferritin-like protein